MRERERVREERGEERRGKETSGSKLAFDNCCIITVKRMEGLGGDGGGAQGLLMHGCTLRHPDREQADEGMKEPQDGWRGGRKPRRMQCPKDRVPQKGGRGQLLGGC